MLGHGCPGLLAARLTLPLRVQVGSAHERYRPNDWDNKKCRDKMKKAHEAVNEKGMGQKHRLDAYLEVTEVRRPHSVLRLTAQLLSPDGAHLTVRVCAGRRTSSRCSTTFSSSGGRSLQRGSSGDWPTPPP